jgi:hypothetical protein
LCPTRLHLYYHFSFSDLPQLYLFSKLSRQQPFNGNCTAVEWKETIIAPDKIEPIC